jgi:hypothetical protein
MIYDIVKKVDMCLVRNKTEIKSQEEGIFKLNYMRACTESERKKEGEWIQ